MLNRNSFLNILFPICCISCGKQGEYLCTRCKKSITTHPSICPRCYSHSPGGKTCYVCKKDLPLSGCIIGFSYSGCIKKLIHLLKYKHLSTVSSFLAGQLSWHIKTHLLSERPFIICPIPTHRRKVAIHRGYDHIDLMSQELAQGTEHLSTHLLIKHRYTHSQIGLSRKARYANLQNSLSISPDISLKGDETILLLDDLFTSGATLTTAANCLLSRRPQLTIWGCVLSRNMGI